MFSIPELSWFIDYIIPCSLQEYMSANDKLTELKSRKDNSIYFWTFNHAWKIHSQGFYSNSRWNAAVPGIKWKHWRWVPLVEQELLTLPEYSSSPGVHVSQSSVFCSILWTITNWCLSVWTCIFHHQKWLGQQHLIVYKNIFISIIWESWCIKWFIITIVHIYNATYK